MLFHIIQWVSNSGRTWLGSSLLMAPACTTHLVVFSSCLAERAQENSTQVTATFLGLFLSLKCLVPQKSSQSTLGAQWLVSPQNMEMEAVASRVLRADARTSRCPFYEILLVKASHRLASIGGGIGRGKDLLVDRKN